MNMIRKGQVQGVEKGEDKSLSSIGSPIMWVLERMKQHVPT